MFQIALQGLGSKFFSEEEKSTRDEAAICTLAMIRITIVCFTTFNFFCRASFPRRGGCNPLFCLFVWVSCRWDFIFPRVALLFILLDSTWIVAQSLCVASGLVDSAQLCPLAISKDGLPGFMVTPDGNKRGGMCISKKARNHRKHDDSRKAPFQGMSIFSDSSQPTSTSSSSSISMLASSMISMVTMCSILLSPNTSTSSCLPPTWWSSSGSSSTWPFVSTWKF